LGSTPGCRQGVHDAEELGVSPVRPMVICWRAEPETGSASTTIWSAPASTPAVRRRRGAVQWVLASERSCRPVALVSVVLW